MDYEKLHKDTITKLQEMVNSGKITVEIARGICADFIPEDEDERIRKFLTKCVKENMFVKSFMADGFDKDEVLTLLDTMQEEHVSNVWHDAKIDSPQAKKKSLQPTNMVLASVAARPTAVWC